MMAALLTSGWIAAIILVLTIGEIAALVWYRKATGRGLAVMDFLPNILAGDFLLLAWLLDAQGATWPWIGLALLGSLVSHLTDMIRRWRREITKS